jgi:hypothetical protein
MADEIRNPVKVQYNQILFGSRLASAAGGLGRDDSLRHSLLEGRGAKRVSCRAKSIGFILNLDFEQKSALCNPKSAIVTGGRSAFTLASFIPFP